MKHKVDKFIKNPKKALFYLSIPIVITLLVQTLYNIVDTIYIGRLGTDAIAALTFSFPIFFVFIALNTGIGIGMGSMISRWLGSKKKKAAENTAIHGLLLGILIALFLVVIGLFSINHLFVLFGATGNVVKLSTDYMNLILIGLFLMFPAQIIMSIFSSQGDTKTMMKIQVSALVLNIILDPIFIYTLNLGVKGAAIATSLSFLLSLVLAIYYLSKGSYLRIHLNSFSWDPKIFLNMFKVGFPASLNMLLIAFYIIFINRLMAYFGTDYVAAFGMASRLEQIAVVPILSIATKLKL